MRDDVAGPDGSALSEGLGAPYLTRWVMHDNHTFTRLPADGVEAYALAMKCFDEDGGWIDLCGTWSDERTNPYRRRPVSLQARGRETRAAFAEAALKWLHANPGAQRQVNRARHGAKDGR